MKYTNRHNLPEEVFKVLSKDRYVKGVDTDYSVTTLKTPPRIVQLQRRHADELEEDVIDNLWSMFGSMAHNLLEEHGSDESLTEERLTVRLQNRNISGQVDHFKGDTITDYKVTSAWTLVYGSRIKEWEEQLNMYAYLFKEHGYTVRKIRIVAILRDWDKNKAKADKAYPQAPIQIIPITLWSTKDQKEYINARVIEQVKAEVLKDDSLPACSAEDMWEQPTKYAVMKVGGKRAIRVLESEEDAQTTISSLSDKAADDPKNPYSITKRQGKRTRCEEYCSVNAFCIHYQEYMKAKEDINEAA